MTKKTPIHTIQREATEDEMAQSVINIFRRLFGLPIRTTSAEAYQAKIREYETKEGESK